jgi:cysteinyl-tRNA synthetase
MSKSLGNLVLLEDILAKGYSPLAVRYYFLTSNYRGSMNFTDEGIESAKNSLAKVYDFVSGIKINEEKGFDRVFLEKFAEKLGDDFNTAGALAVMWDLINSAVDREVKLNTLLKMDEVLGLKLVDLVGFEVPKEIENMAKIRWTYKKEGIFDKADFLRREIEKLGYEVLDSKDGYQIKKIFK